MRKEHAQSKRLHGIHPGSLGFLRSRNDVFFCTQNPKRDESLKKLVEKAAAPALPTETQMHINLRKSATINNLQDFAGASNGGAIAEESEEEAVSLRN
jgi:hypothetical protein